MGEKICSEPLEGGSGHTCSAFLQTQFVEGSLNLATTNTIVHP